MPLEETDGEIRPQFEREEDKTDTGTQEGYASFPLAAKGQGGHAFAGLK